MAVLAQSGIVVFGDVVSSRAVARSADWLRSLRTELDATYGALRLAGWEFTQGDELQGLLATSADPFEAVIRASVRADRLPMRWVMVAGEIDPGRGPATQRTGPAYLTARKLSGGTRRRRGSVTVRTRDRAVDELLDGVAPVLGRLLDELTPRQRAIARLLLVEGLSQADAARRLGIRAPTVSVAADRARVREIHGLHETARRLLAAATAPLERQAS